MRPTALLATTAATALLLGAAPAVPAGPGAASGPPSTPTEVPTGVELVQVPAEGSVELPASRELRDRLLEDLDPADPRTVVDVVAAHVAEVWGTQVVSDVMEEEPDAEEEPLALTGGTFAQGQGHGDFDGDGLDDALVVTYDVDAGVRRLRALRGLDGADLWSTALTTDATIGWPAGDVTGDATDDLLLLDYEVHESDGGEVCDDAGCSGWYEASWTWTLGARSGADGRVLWEEQLPGHYRHEYEQRSTSEGDEYSEQLVALDLAALPYPGADHDGDGGRDLVVNVIDLAYSHNEHDTATTPVTTEYGGETQLDSTTAARLVRGTDGTSLLGTLVSQGPNIAVLQRAGDATADGTDDLLWERVQYTDDTWSCDHVVVTSVCEDERSSQEPVLALELLDGSDLTTAWTFQAPIDPWFGYAAPVLDDVDGVAGDDVLVNTMTGSGDDPSDPWTLGRSTEELQLLSGADGTASWAAEPPDGFLHTVADMGGSDAADLLFTLSILSSRYCSDDPVTGEACDSSSSATLVAVRLDGATGEVLSDTTTTYDLGEPGDYFWFAFSYFSGDHDGDGLVDLRMNAGTGNRGVALVQSAATGETLFEHVGDGEDPLLLTTGLGDLDGTGTDELGTTRWSDEAVRILTMPQQDLLHELPWSELPAPGGDQDGVTGHELIDVRHEVGDDGVVHAFVESLQGVSLQPRWTRELTDG